MSLPQGLNSSRWVTGLQSIPVVHEFALVDLRPGNHESFLPAGQYASNRLDRVDPKDSDAILVVGMEMGSVMRTTSLDEHSNYDTEEAADLRHLV
jgi:hypothetical protein